jgi:hypothetical protein
VLSLSLLLSAGGLNSPPSASAGDPAAAPAKAEARRLPPAQRYAGEILAYLLEIVTGRLGDPDLREEWRTRGVDLPLPGLAEVEAVMMDSARNELTLMVLDPDLRFLTRVLYHYDPRLSLHKGMGGIYPAPEFVALRLLLLGKIHRGERIRLGPLMERSAMLLNTAGEVPEEDLQAVGLSEKELRLIREILASEPHLIGYLGSPHMVSALWRIGVVERDAFVERKLREASYAAVPCGCEGTAEENVRVAVLPSLITEFEALEGPAPGAPFGFVPTDRLLRLQADLADAVGSRAPGATFCLEQVRPLVIHPANAEKAIREVCPDADFVVILTDKNLYLPMHIDEEQDTWPRVSRVYLDVLDIEYDQAGDRVEEVAAFVRSRLR